MYYFDKLRNSQHNFDDMIFTFRRLGIFFLSADYTKYALGFFQLASMAELAVVIYQSSKLIKNSRRSTNQRTVTNTPALRASVGGSIVVPRESIATTHQQSQSFLGTENMNTSSKTGSTYMQNLMMKRSLYAIYFGCSFMALTSIACGIYNIQFIIVYQPNGEESDPVSEFKYTIELFQNYINEWTNEQQVMSSVLLAILSTCLITSYVILIYNLCTYFRQQMGQEMVRLTILFATFTLSYIFRFIYHLGIVSQGHIYCTLIPSMITRWAIILILPTIWDLASILSIMVLHCKSFRQT